ncbi:MAG: lipid-A-disaccharide synthase [Acidobacteria bacterium]|nr:lipid-A-disaccharide synthase [Acidobacteriota bacterium]
MKGSDRVRVLISCGEASGDLYAGALARELRAMDPDVAITGLGGDRLRDAGATLVGDYRGLTVTGLAEALKVLPRSYAMYRRLVAAARAARPDVFVAIDFPDFNFRLAGVMKRLGVPVVYYISPQLWAWRSGRMRTMQRIASHVLVIFPFEEPLYREAGVPVSFVGHPLLELTGPAPSRGAFLAGIGLNAGAQTVALLPGSRPNEVRALLPTMVQAAARIVRARAGTQFVVARAPHLEDALFEPATRAAAPMAIVEGRADEVLASSDITITASGTATVQAAIHDCPMVIVYRLSPLSYRMGKPFVKVDTYGMVNLIAGRRIAPELIQEDCTAERVTESALALLTDPAEYAAAKQGLRDVRARLGTPGASRRAAEAVLGIARGATAPPRHENILR